MLRGLVLCTLWRWFVVDAFHVAPLSIPRAMGISIIVALLTHQQSFSPDKEQPPFWLQMVTGLVISGFALGMGWVYQLFL